MKGLNAYEFKGELVSILKQTPESVFFITASGIIKEVPQKDAIVVEADLVRGGTYSGKFIQAALGGLTAAPSYIKKSGGMMLYPGKLVKAFVEPKADGLVIYGAGVPQSAWGGAGSPGAEIVADSKIPAGKSKVIEPTVPQPDGRSFNGKGGQNGKSLVDEAEDEANDDGTPESLPISSGAALSDVQSITIKWLNPEVSGSIQEIKDLFGDGMVLPSPDSIAIETETEKIVSKKNSGVKSKPTKSLDTDTTIAASEYTTVKTAKTVTAGGIEFGLQGVMSHSCSKCQSMNMYEYDYKTDTTKTVCPVCNHTEVYERI